MAPCDETEGVFQEGLEARSSQIPGQHLALGAPSLNKQNPAGISSSPEARARLKAAKENCLGKILFAPCATPALAEGNSWHSCAWTGPSGFPSTSTGPPAAAASLAPVDNSSSPILLGHISHSAPPALTEDFPTGTPHRLWIPASSTRSFCSLSEFCLG